MSRNLFLRSIHALCVGTIVLTALVFVVCKDHEPPFTKGGRQFSGSTQTARKFDTSAVFEQLLVLQDSINKSPNNRMLVSQYLSLSLDTSSGCFLVVGKGVGNPEFPEKARAESRKRAAQFDGNRWALYAKAWNTGSAVPFGKAIAGNIVYSEILYEREILDTLCVLMRVPIGSVILE
jgi:hypothetical protein